MYRRFHDRFGTAGVVIAVIALVAALGGTAFAAGGLNSTQKKEVTKIAKKYAGKPGAAGAAGTPGTNGTNGKDGGEGKAGTNGSNGKNVETGNATVGECPEGGATVQVAGEPATKKKACNGEEGPEGPPGPPGSNGTNGSPWTAGGTLPANATETGMWEFEASSSARTRQAASFPIPLAASLDVNHVHFINPAGKEVIYDFVEEEFKEVTSTQCLGTVAAPKATSGNLCFYAKKLTGWILVSNLSILNPATEASGAGTTGAYFKEAIELGVAGSGRGTWAVTG